MIELYIGAKVKKTLKKSEMEKIDVEKKQLDSSIKNVLSEVIQLPFAETKKADNLEHGNCIVQIPGIQFSYSYENIDDFIREFVKWAKELPKYENIEDEYEKAQKEYEDKQFDAASSDFFNIYFVSSQFQETCEFAIRSAIYLCEIYVENKKVERAAVYAIAAYNLSRNNPLNPNINYITAFQMGVINNLQEKFNEAIKYFGEAYQQSESMESIKWGILVLWEIVKIYFCEGQYKDGIEEIEEIINIIQKDSSLKDDYSTLYNLRTIQTDAYKILIDQLEKTIEDLNKKTLSFSQELLNWIRNLTPSLVEVILFLIKVPEKIAVNIGKDNTIVIEETAKRIE